MEIWIVAAICAFFVKGMCGFANTLVFTSILSFGTNNINISPVDLLLGFPTNAIMACKERKSIRWRFCLPIAGIVIIGSIPGILFLKNIDTSYTKILFGVVIVLLGIEMLVREQLKSKPKESKVILLVIGLLSGILCGLYGVGALLGAYMSRVTEDSHSFKANICVVFLIENIFRIILYSAWGIISLETIKRTVFLLPFVLLGLMLGMQGSKLLDEKKVKKIVIMMLIVSGVALIATNM